MGDIPLPEGIPVVYKLLLWIISGLILLLLLLGSKFFNIFKTKFDKIEKASEENASNINIMNISLKTIVLDIKTAEADFQKNITKQMMKFEQEALKLTGFMDRIIKKITNLNSHVDGELILASARIKRVEEDLQYTNKTLVTNHENVWGVLENANKNINIVHETIMGLEKNINRHENLFKSEITILKNHSKQIDDIRTDIKQLGKDSIMISTKKDK